MIPYPPYIDGSLPAFARMVKIPFTMNPAVSISMVKAFAVKFMTLQGKILGVQKVMADSTMFTKGYISFSLDTTAINAPVLGHYKIQIAYLDGSEKDYQTLAYSDVGIVKRTQPYSSGVWTNDNGYSSFALTITTADINEPVYKYKFYIYKIKNGNQSLFYSQDWKLHNTELDIVESQIPRRTIKLSFFCNKNYTPNTQYKVVCSAYTLNGASYSSTSNTFTYVEPAGKNIAGTSIKYFQDAQEQEKGCIKIQIKMTENTPIGQYFIKRKTSKNNYTTWENIYSFNVSTKYTSNKTISYLDTSVEQGVSYCYSLVRYNNNKIITHEEFYTDAKTKEVVKQQVDFEYIFLSDSTHNLKLKFNSSINSFKETIQENQVTTIGSKYPFFFRNGNVSYKEFPISGLITYLMDDYETFVTKENLGLDKNMEYEQYDAMNFYGERNFKQKVLEWLNNGQPKLFKSATEGNFIVRLTNVSLSPFSGTNNLIHSFSATAIEVDDFNNFNKLKELKLIS